MRSKSVEQKPHDMAKYEPQDSRRAQTDVPDDVNPDVPSIEDFKLKNSLGKGSFGDVTLAIEKSTGNSVAIKELHIPDILKRDKKEAVIREGRILETLRGRPFIITLFYKFKEDSSLYFVFEHGKHGTLSSLIQKKKKFERELCVKYGAQMLESIDQIHSAGIMHRDFKPENILIDENYRLKIVSLLQVSLV